MRHSKTDTKWRGHRQDIRTFYLRRPIAEAFVMRLQQTFQIMVYTVFFAGFGGQASAQGERWPVSARDAVARSIAQPDAPLPAMPVLIEVCGTGEQDGRGYLNSMKDYRDRRSLNVELMPDVRDDLTERLGGDPVDILRNKRIVVWGEVRQQPVYRSMGREPKEPLYLKTQMRLSSSGLLDAVLRRGMMAEADCASGVVDERPER